MRNTLVLAAALLAFAGAVQAADAPPEAEAGLATVRQHLKTPDKTRFSSVKVDAAGNVCGKARVGGDDDVMWMLTTATGELWVNEGPDAQYSFFTWDTAVHRSTDRPPYMLWKACQKGK